MIRRTALLLGLLVTACSSKPEGPPAESCHFHGDCTKGVCFQGKCSATATCFDRSQCNAVPICAGMTCICEDNRCLPVCVTDNDCPSDGQCVNGVCTPYPVAWSGAEPASGARGTLKVGLGRADLDYPMGVSMAGYAARHGPRTPYQEALGGSNAWLGRPDARAVAFDDGKEMFVLLRIPTGWSTDEILAETARKVQAKTGLDLSHRIVTTAPHSHSLPARYWHLVKGLNFGFFGFDEFSFEVFDRTTGSYAEAIEMALDDLHPARFGYTVLENFDPSDKIHRDRREQNNNLPGYMKKDDRMLLMRIDDMAGSPIAVLTNFGMHGTVFGGDNPIISADAPGGVEAAITERASAKYGHPVLGMYVQGNAGDISPGGDYAGHHEAEQCQLVGALAWDVIEPALDRITTSAEVPVGIVDQRVPITHDILGYGAGEFHDVNVVCENSPPYFRYGAFQCVDGYHLDSDPATKFADGDLACVFAVECLTDGYPIPQFQKTHLSVGRLGDLAFATMPGEPVSQFGRDLSDRIKDALPGIHHAVTFGYSQDHHFYLLNADDWMQGGYEPSRDIWGWKLGPYLQDHAVTLARELAKEPEARVVDDGNLKPMVWTDPAEDLAYVAATDTEGAPDEILSDAPASAARLELVTFGWRGGHPGIDRPHVTLEVDGGSGFAPVQKAGQLPYDDAGFEMLVHYDGQCDGQNCARHAWHVEWQERRDFPTGRYRFTAEGHARRGGQTVSYTVHSRAFDLVPTTKLAISGLALTNGRLEGRVSDPPVLRKNADGSADDRAGHLLLSTLVPSYVGAPIADGVALAASGTLTRPDRTTAPLSGTPAHELVTEPRQRIVSYGADGTPVWANAGTLPTTKFTLAMPANAASGDVVVLTLTDPAGNSGTVTATIAP